MLGGHFWYWRLGYALWLENLRGSAFRVAGLDCERDFIYGETPPGTAWQLLRWAQFEVGSRLVEIGCGRAVMCLVAELALRGQCRGYEALPELADKARWLVEALSLKTHIETQQVGQIEVADLYYLTPTTWSEANFLQVCQALETAPKASKALVLSRPLPGWKVLATHSFAYSWGWTRTYLQVKT